MVDVRLPPVRVLRRRHILTALDHDRRVSHLIMHTMYILHPAHTAAPVCECVYMLGNQNAHINVEVTITCNTEATTYMKRLT